MNNTKGLLDRIAEGPVICAEGYLFELERRGYLSAGAYVPEVVLEHPEVAVSVAQVLAVRLINMNNHLVHVKDGLSNLQSSLDSYLPVFPERPEDLKS